MTDTRQFPDKVAEEGKKLAVDEVQYRSKVDARLETPFTQSLASQGSRPSDCQLTFELYDTIIKE